MNSQELKTVVKRVSLVDTIFETLVEAIVSGQLPPGSELNSVELAKQLEVSRTPLREALRLLARDGFVQQVSNFKARVTKFSAEDIQEIYEVRLQLETAAAEFAARRMSKEQLDELRAEAAELDTQRNDVDWAEKAIAYDLRFHATIANASGNRRLEAEILRYRQLVRSFCIMTGQQSTLEQAFEEHLTILDAIAAGKPALARKAMATHISARLAVVLSKISEDASKQ